MLLVCHLIWITYYAVWVSEWLLFNFNSRRACYPLRHRYGQPFTHPVFLHLFNWYRNIVRVWNILFITGHNYTVKLAHVVTSIKHSPVFKGHLFLFRHRKFHMKWTSFHLSYKANISVSQKWLLNTSLIVYKCEVKLRHLSFFSQVIPVS